MSERKKVFRDASEHNVNKLKITVAHNPTIDSGLLAAVVEEVVSNTTVHKHSITSTIPAFKILLT